MNKITLLAVTLAGLSFGTHAAKNPTFDIDLQDGAKVSFICNLKTAKNTFGFDGVGKYSGVKFSGFALTDYRVFKQMENMSPYVALSSYHMSILGEGSYRYKMTAVNSGSFISGNKSGTLIYDPEELKLFVEECPYKAEANRLANIKAKAERDQKRAAVLAVRQAEILEQTKKVQAEENKLEEARRHAAKEAAFIQRMERFKCSSVEECDQKEAAHKAEQAKIEQRRRELAKAERQREAEEEQEILLLCKIPVSNFAENKIASYTIHSGKSVGSNKIYCMATVGDWLYKVRYNKETGQYRTEIQL